MKKSIILGLAMICSLVPFAAGGCGSSDSTGVSSVTEPANTIETTDSSSTTAAVSLAELEESGIKVEYKGLSYKVPKDWTIKTAENGISGYFSNDNDAVVAVLTVFEGDDLSGYTESVDSLLEFCAQVHIKADSEIGKLSYKKGIISLKSNEQIHVMRMECFEMAKAHIERVYFIPTKDTLISLHMIEYGTDYDEIFDVIFETIEIDENVAVLSNQ